VVPPTVTARTALFANPTYREGTTMVSRTASPSLDLNIDGDKALVRFPGAQFGTVERQPEDAQLLSNIVELQQPQLILDFSNVEFLTSLGLSMLLTLRKRLAEGGRRLAILNLQPHVYEVFSVTRLNTLFDVRQQDAA
jgi:stage II sporulation protein AA (anti-sigma F factor antagonist)